VVASVALVAVGVWAVAPTPNDEQEPTGIHDIARAGPYSYEASADSRRGDPEVKLRGDAAVMCGDTVDLTSGVTVHDSEGFERSVRLGAELTTLGETTDATPPATPVPLDPNKPDGLTTGWDPLQPRWSVQLSGDVGSFELVTLLMDGQTVAGMAAGTSGSSNVTGRIWASGGAPIPRIGQCDDSLDALSAEPGDPMETLLVAQYWGASTSTNEDTTLLATIVIDPALPPNAGASLPVFKENNAFSEGSMNGPQDGVNPDLMKASQDIQDRFACGVPWNLEAGYYPRDGYAGPMPEYTGSLAPTAQNAEETTTVGEFGNPPVLDASAGDLAVRTSLVAFDDGFYDTFVLAWVQDGVIVGNQRVSMAAVQFVGDSDTTSLSTARGGDSSAPGIGWAPLSAPGACANGQGPDFPEDGDYQLHIVHEYGTADAFVDDKLVTTSNGAPGVDVDRVEFRSGDAYTQVVDPAGGPWTVHVIGLTTPVTLDDPAKLIAPDGDVHQAFVMERAVPGCSALADIRADGFPHNDAAQYQATLAGVTGSLTGQLWMGDTVATLAAGEDPWYLGRDAWLVADGVSPGKANPHVEWTSVDGSWVLAEGGRDPLEAAECAYLDPRISVSGAVFLVIDGVDPAYYNDPSTDFFALPEELQTWIYLGHTAPTS
jgi:hypothetical protein